MLTLHVKVHLAAKDITDHEAKCPLEPLPCQHKGCAVRILRKDYDKHAADCGFKMVKCKIAECKVVKQLFHGVLIH